MKHVVVVEDDVDIAFLLLHQLRYDPPLKKMTTLHFSSADSALDKRAWDYGDEYEVVGLIDLMLPRISGIEVAEWVRQEIGDHIQLIGLTAAGKYSPIFVEAEESGFFDHVMTKPIDYQELYKLIRKEQT